jgi:hypothetical protein
MILDWFSVWLLTETPECYATICEFPVAVQNLFYLLLELAGCSEPKVCDVRVSASTYRLIDCSFISLLPLLNQKFT